MTTTYSAINTQTHARGPAREWMSIAILCAIIDGWVEFEIEVVS